MYGIHQESWQTAFTQEFIEGPEDPIPTETPIADDEIGNDGRIHEETFLANKYEPGSIFSMGAAELDTAILLQNICVKFFDDNGIVCAGLKVKTSPCGVIMIITTLSCIGPVPLSVFEGAYGALTRTANFDWIFDPTSSVLDYDMVSGVSTLSISFKH
ncbi:unnamed protein product [Agarophyton chilense]